MTELDWQALTSAALVGTARRPVPAVGTGVRSRAGATADVDLLDRAALVGAARRAGWQPPHLTLPEAAPPDQAREPTPRQAQLLTVSVLQSPAGARMRTALLARWCEHAARAGVHAPAALLPHLMELATADRALRPALRSVLDSRGRWLASQQPVWGWALADDPAAPPPEASWEHLGSRQRPGHLRRLRSVDPDVARDLLMGSWSTESAKDRAELLACLSTGLSLDDEPVLESALDDGAGGVRKEAAALLSRLPGSARARRMRARLAPLVSQHGVLRKTINVELPDDPDRAAVRDGLGKAPRGQSQRAWWLRELIVGTPLTFWSGMADTDPGTVVHRVHQDEVLRSMVAAAVAQQDPLWAAVLLPRAETAELPALAGVLPDAVIERRALALLRGSDTAGLGVLLSAMAAFGPELSRRLVSSMSRPMPGPRILLLEPDVLMRLHPDCQPELLGLSRRTDLAQHERRVVGDLVQLFSVQQSISEAFT